jgi:hypothetical protein
VRRHLNRLVDLGLVARIAGEGRPRWTLAAIGLEAAVTDPETTAAYNAVQVARLHRETAESHPGTQLDLPFAGTPLAALQPCN